MLNCARVVKVVCVMASLAMRQETARLEAARQEAVARAEESAARVARVVEVGYVLPMRAAARE